MEFTTRDGCDRRTEDGEWSKFVGDLDSIYIVFNSILNERDETKEAEVKALLSSQCKLKIIDFSLSSADAHDPLKYGVKKTSMI